ncbi:response regulator [Coprobacillus sp. AM29-13]|nr:response regulator [Coprobacillus sp. AF19-3]RHT49647.1 response regulator [Coprobacillus sp. AM29-13]
MKKIIITIGKNSQTIFLLIILVIGFVILLNMIAFFYKKHKNPRFSQKEFLNNIFYEDQSQVYVLVRKKDYKVLFLSSHFEEVFHILPKRIQVDIEVLKEIVEDDTYRQFLKEYKQWNQQEPFKYSFKMKDENKWFILTITAIEHGKYHLFAFYDHSEDVLKEKDYLKQIETTKNESEYKASFLSRMSHEIRTPMNGIIGMLTLARNTQDTKQEDYYLQQAQDISQYLLSLINEVLDMSRMEAGKLELENKPFNIYHLEPQLNNIFKETIEKKDVMFKIEYFDFDVKYFVGDELRIMQILVNLLSNASKFTEKGEIKVTFRQMYKEDQVANIMMRVHDTGKGMSREFLSHIFRPFEQEGVEISKKYGGSGLGMAITDQLVKLMGGEIVVDSLEGKGSDFTVFLNLPISTNQQYEDKKEVVVEEFSFDQKRILLAEDNDINAEICLSVLNAKGAFVERVENGQVAVETFKKHAEHYYDLILMDIQMPEMNGYEATQAIRSLNREDSQSIPIFALSADAYVENKRYSKKTGMNGHFSKPIDFDEMEKELGQFFSRRDIDEKNI